MPEPDVSILLPRLPDIKRIGGNRRGHWAAEYRAFLEDSLEWQVAFCMAVPEPWLLTQTARYGGPVSLRFTITWPHSKKGRLPDRDNTQAALKTLIDCLETWHMVGQGKTRGFAGIIKDDSQVQSIDIVYQRGDTGSTLLELWEVRE